MLATSNKCLTCLKIFKAFEGLGNKKVIITDTILLNNYINKLKLIYYYYVLTQSQLDRINYSNELTKIAKIVIKKKYF